MSWFPIAKREPSQEVDKATSFLGNEPRKKTPTNICVNFVKGSVIEMRAVQIMRDDKGNLLTISVIDRNEKLHLIYPVTQLDIPVENRIQTQSPKLKLKDVKQLLPNWSIDV
jgi:hypothetical protein